MNPQEQSRSAELTSMLAEMANSILDKSKATPTKFQDVSDVSIGAVMDKSAFHIISVAGEVVVNARSDIEDARKNLQLAHALISKNPSEKEVEGKVSMIKAIDQALADAINGLIEADRMIINDAASISA